MRTMKPSSEVIHPSFLKKKGNILTGTILYTVCVQNYQFLTLMATKVLLQSSARN